MTEEALEVTHEAPQTVADLDTGTPVTGRVTFLAPYGAMIDIGLERQALLHISQIGRSDFRNIDDVLTIGEEVEAFVLKVDKENRIALTTEKPPALPWSKIQRGSTYPGTVTRIENYGAFVDIGAERDGMVHVSELADGYVQSPNDVVSIGDSVEVRVIKLNKRNRQIDLSMKSSQEEIQAAFEPEEDVPSAMELAFRRAQKRAAGNNRRDDKKKSHRDNRQDDIIARTLRSQDN